jgi:hypothetical protein
MLTAPLDLLADDVDVARGGALRRDRRAYRAGVGLQGAQRIGDVWNAVSTTLR